MLAQSFEGEIIYTARYKSKNPQMTDAQLTAAMGAKQDYLVKGGSYKSIMNGSLMQWQIYDTKENKLYTKMAHADVAYWNDAGVQNDEILSVKINKNAAEILGYSCDEIIMTCKSGVQKYYFNAKIAADPKMFGNHKFGNWSELISRTKALPLKMSIETAGFDFENVATEIIPKKIDSKEFALPAGIKTEKSPY
ncbi:MAG: hypothetical protein INR69_12645 [Mucilaginibacter polytrichastri]|nr:hypothetical protein [Mucilaginibacter polytrichastri]